jgi:hypothetical protein
VLGWAGAITFAVALTGGCSRQEKLTTRPVLDEPLERESIEREITVTSPVPVLGPGRIAPPGVETLKPLIADPAVVVQPRIVARRLDYVTNDDARWNALVGRWEARRPAVRRDRPEVEGVAVIDRNDADRDGYVEYLDSGNYVAELKSENRIAAAPAAAAHPQEVTVRGQVVELEVVAFRDPPDPQLLAVLEQPDGQRVLVNLGPQIVVSKLGIRIGTIIGVAAQVGSINGRSALVAHDIIIDGQTTTISPSPVAQ